MRLDKYLADCNLGTRSEVKKYIASKRVMVNEQIVQSPKVHVSENDVVTVDNQVIHYQAYQYLMMNKPSGVLSATKDGKTQTVIDVLDEKDRYNNLFPVGRLDKDTTGFVLLTNNGGLAHDMLHPKKHVSKQYTAVISPPLTNEACEQFSKGILLEDGTKCLPAKLMLGNTDLKNAQTVSITIEEGKFHQIKRMIAACGSHVEALHRHKIGPLELDANLNEGEYRYLTISEIELLLKGSK